jgi:elongator complex protein 1
VREHAEASLQVKLFAVQIFVLMSDGTVLCSKAASIVWDALLPPVEGTWRWAEYLSETNALVCVATSGEIACVDAETTEVSTKGCIDGGVRAVAFTPGQDMVAFMTGTNTLLTMTTYWGELGEVPFPEPEAGSECSIVWRSDGQYLVTSMLEKGELHRELRVWTQDLELHGVGRHEDSSTVTGMGGALGWSTNTALIAAPAVVRGDTQLLLFETNGLRHREFSVPGLREGEGDVVWCAWNGESDLLGLQLTMADGTDVVQLWHRDNYHWYCKQEWVMPGAVECIQWDSEVSYRLWVLLSPPPGTPHVAALVTQWDVCWDTHCTSDAACTVMCVDGAELRLTPLGISPVPPPMSYATVTAPATPATIAASPAQDTVLAVVQGAGTPSLLLGGGTPDLAAPLRYEGRTWPD